MAEHNASEASKLRKDLEAAKLREAEVQSQLTESQQREAVVCNKNLALMDQRDAATGALEIARTALAAFTTHYSDGVIHEAENALAKISDPSAALAERDRATEKRTAERCAELADSAEQADYVYLSSAAIRGEFNLEPKPEGE